jgi:hypothetical protein
MKKLLSKKQLKSMIQKIILEGTYPEEGTLGERYVARHSKPVKSKKTWKQAQSQAKIWGIETGYLAWAEILPGNDQPATIFIGPEGTLANAIPFSMKDSMDKVLNDVFNEWYIIISNEHGDGLSYDKYGNGSPNDLPEYVVDNNYRFYFGVSPDVWKGKYDNALKLEDADDFIRQFLDMDSLNGKVEAYDDIAEANRQEMTTFYDNWGGTALVKKAKDETEEAEVPEETGDETGDKIKEEPDDKSDTIGSTMDQLEAAVNKYINDHHLDKTVLMQVDGEWVGNEDDNAWAHFVTHTLGPDGAHPAKEKNELKSGDVNLISTNWANGASKVGYNNDVEGALKFAQDAKKAAEKAEEAEEAEEAEAKSGGSKGGSDTDGDAKDDKKPGTEADDKKKSDVTKKKSDLPLYKSSDIVVRFEGSLEKYKDKTTLKKNIQNAAYEAMPAGKEVRKHFSVSLRVGVGGKVKPKYSLRPEGFKTEAFNKSIADAVTGLRNTRGKITIKIPRGKYTKLNKVNEFVKLLKKMIR